MVLMKTVLPGLALSDKVAYCNGCGIPHSEGACLRGIDSAWSNGKQRLEAAKDGGSTLSDIDPFADVVADTDAPEPFTEAPAKKAAPKKATTPKAESTGREGLTVTLKGGAGFDAPWIVIHAADIPDAYEQLSGDQAAVLVELMDKVKKAGNHFSGGSAKANTSGGAPARPGNEAPEGTSEAPGPDWTYKTGVGKNGKTWKAWMPPRGSSEQPVWL